MHIIYHLSARISDNKKKKRKKEAKPNTQQKSNNRVKSRVVDTRLDSIDSPRHRKVMKRFADQKKQAEKHARCYDVKNDWIL
jgi:hypothetical protein